MYTALISLGTASDDDDDDLFYLFHNLLHFMLLQSIHFSSQSVFKKFRRQSN